MDPDDFDHFKTIASQLQKPQIGLSTPPNAVNSPSRHDQASCLLKAKAIFGAYRRDEAHDPETFVAALAAVLGDYPGSVVDYAADPRTGIVSEYRMGLPNVGQIAEFCDATERRMALAARPTAIPAPRAEPQTKPGQINSTEFARLVAEGKTPIRPVGAFEKGGYLGPA